MPASRKSNMAERKITIKQTFNASPSLVFQAWTDPASVRRWWGPKAFTNPVVDIDLRVGGIFKVVMRSPDGTTYTTLGFYREVDAPYRLVFENKALDEHGNELVSGVTTVTLAEKAGSTDLTLIAEATALAPDAEIMLQSMEAGWRQSLEGLAQELAK